MYIVITHTLIYLFYMDVMFRNKVIELKLNSTNFMLNWQTQHDRRKQYLSDA